MRVFTSFIISEGEKYTIDKVEVIGDMPLDPNIVDPIVNSQKRFNLLSSTDYTD